MRFVLIHPPLGRLRASLWLSAGLACSGPDLKPTVFEQPPGAEIPPLVVPEGGECSPETLSMAESLPELEPTGDGAPAPPPCTESPTHTPILPLGIGYPDVENPLPDHVAYLTFDDGPSEWTNEFLDILRDKGVPATFFVTAKQLKGDLGLDATYEDVNGNTVVYRDILKRIVDEGHVLANHTVNHPDLGRITPSQITAEFEQNELFVSRALVRAGGKPQILSLVRPPYGSPWFTGIAGKATPEASDRLSSHGLNIMWTVTSGDSSDWALGESYSRTAEPTRDPNPPTFDVKKARVRDDVLASGDGDGIIVLMHDTHAATRDVLEEIIDGLASVGYSFDTIEHYVNWRWSRPSMDLTPGPNLYQACVPERDWGCHSADPAALPGQADPATQVCGRMWLAFTAFGGVDGLGEPVAAPVQDEVTGIYSQQFDLGRVELHPENPAPCNMIAFR
jgi:peptidoglycan/xylan/chitin deacetylase (PgdA/CDA1 family)